MPSTILVSSDGKREVAVPTTSGISNYRRLLVWARSELGIPQTDPCFFRHQRKLVLDWAMSLPAGRIELITLDQLGDKELRDIMKSRDALVKITVMMPDGSAPALTVKGGTTLLALLNQVPGIDLYSLVGQNIFPTVFNGVESIREVELLSRTTIWDLGLAGRCSIKITFELLSVSTEQMNASLSTHLSERTKLIENEITQNISMKIPENNYVFDEEYDIDLVITEAPTASPTFTTLDLPDSFYNLTANELKQFQMSATRTAKNLTERPLLSKVALERVHEREVLQSHPFTRIRLRFPDGLTVERNFKTEDSFDYVNAWVRKILLKSGCPEFVLSVGPPPRVLKPTDTILGLKLYPAAIVNVAWSHAGKVSTQSIMQATGEEYSPAPKRITSPTTVQQPPSTSGTGQSTKTKTMGPPKWLKLSK